MAVADETPEPIAISTVFSDATPRRNFIRVIANDPGSLDDMARSLGVTDREMMLRAIQYLAMELIATSAKADELDEQVALHKDALGTLGAFLGGAMGISESKSDIDERTEIRALREAAHRTGATIRELTSEYESMDEDLISDQLNRLEASVSNLLNEARSIISNTRNVN